MTLSQTAARPEAIFAFQRCLALKYGFQVVAIPVEDDGCAALSPGVPAPQEDAGLVRLAPAPGGTTMSPSTCLTSLGTQQPQQNSQSLLSEHQLSL